MKLYYSINVLTETTIRTKCVFDLLSMVSMHLQYLVSEDNIQWLQFTGELMLRTVYTISSKYFHLFACR